MTRTVGKFDLEAAKSDPSRFFETPEEVVRMTGLTDAQKIEILRQWETDARLMSVAEEENMPGVQQVPLDQILNAVGTLTGPSGPSGARRGASSSKLGV